MSSLGFSLRCRGTRHLRSTRPARASQGFVLRLRQAYAARHVFRVPRAPAAPVSVGRLVGVGRAEADVLLRALVQALAAAADRGEELVEVRLERREDAV